MDGYDLNNTKLLVTLTVLAVILLYGQPVSGHGRLIEPPSRASAWRYGFPTPHNYNDHELFCGGFTRQWVKNGGNCGICGDAWDQKTPRPHEYGGRFGQGITVRKYKINSVITIKVDLTANHYGYFEFRLCPYMENTTQECLDQNVLEAYNPEGGYGGTKFRPTDGNKIYEMQYKLPKDLTCDHCVLQWKYIAGNNWGTCANGTGAVGCGNQEEFRACADVAIGLTEGTIIPGSTTVRPRPPYVLPTRRTTTTKTTDVTDRFNGTTTEMPEEQGGSSWIGFLICVVMLCVVIISLALFYFYYYQGGHRIKSLLMKKGKPSPPEPPVRPPRHKKVNMHQISENGETVLNVKTDLDNNIEPGFENIKLNENRI